MCYSERCNSAKPLNWDRILSFLTARTNVHYEKLYEIREKGSTTLVMAINHDLGDSWPKARSTFRITIREEPPSFWDEFPKFDWRPIE